MISFIQSHQEVLTVILTCLIIFYVKMKQSRKLSLDLVLKVVLATYTCLTFLYVFIILATVGWAGIELSSFRKELFIGFIAVGYTAIAYLSDFLSDTKGNPS